MLISQGSQIYGENEEDCAFRLYVSYGVIRATQLAAVFEKIEKNYKRRVHESFWRTVQHHLAEVAAPREYQGFLTSKDNGRKARASLSFLMKGDENEN